MEMITGYTAVAVVTIMVIGVVGLQICKSIDNGVDEIIDGLKKLSEKKTSIREFEDFIHFLAGFSNKADTSEQKAVVEKAIEKSKEKVEEKPMKVGRKTKNPPTRYGETWRTVYYTSPKGVSIEKERYYISNFGRVWDTKRSSFIKPFYSKKQGYMVASFTRNDGKRSVYSMKILVALAFLGYFNPMVKKVVCINGNEMDIQATNSRLATIIKRPKKA